MGDGKRTMKAAVTTGKKREIVVRDVPKPEIGLWCGSLCRLRAGAILGHDHCGEIAEIGKDIKGRPVGDRVTMTRGQGCGECYFCKRQLFRLCLGKENERAIYTEISKEGYGSSNGAFAEYILQSPENLLKIPDGVSDEEAAMVEPLDVGAWLPKSLRFEAVFSGQLFAMSDALNLIARKQIDLKPMFSETLPLDQIQLAFDRLWNGENIASPAKP